MVRHMKINCLSAILKKPILWYKSCLDHVCACLTAMSSDSHISAQKIKVTYADGTCGFLVIAIILRTGCNVASLVDLIP